MPKYILFFSLLCAGLFYCPGCGLNAEKTATLTLSFAFSNPEITACTDYMAENYTVTLFNTDSKQLSSHTFACTREITAKSFSLTPGHYLVTAELRDTRTYLKSTGMVDVQLSSSQTAPVVMDEYTGGILIAWNQSLCSTYDISNLSISVKKDNNPVSVSLWGQQTELSNYPLSCEILSLPLFNTGDGSFAVTVYGFRNSDVASPRAQASVSSVKVVTGQESLVSLSSVMELIVSDMEIKWDFDSKSITGCKDTSVSDISLSFTGNQDNSVPFSFSSVISCSDSARSFLVYDIPAGAYSILINGIDNSKNVLFSGDKSVIIEKGKTGSGKYTELIYLKEIK